MSPPDRWVMRRCPRPTRCRTATVAPATSSLLTVSMRGRGHVPPRDDDRRHLVGERAEGGRRQPVRDEDQALHLELQQLLELGLLVDGVGAARDEHGAVAMGADLGLDAVEDLREDGVVQVEDEDADGAAAPVREAAGRRVGAVPELAGRREDGVAAGLADLGGAAQGQGHQRLRDACPRGHVVDGGPWLPHAQYRSGSMSATSTGHAACDRLLAGDGGAQALQGGVGRAGVRLRAAGQRHERRRLLAEGVAEAVDESRVRIGADREVALQRAQRGPAVEAGRHRVEGAVHLEPDVLPERVVPGAGDRHLDPVRGHGEDRADVRIVELGVLVLGAHGRWWRRPTRSPIPRASGRGRGRGRACRGRCRRCRR